MRVYPLFENEIATLTELNATSTLCFSIGSALVTFGAGIIVSGIMQGQLSASAAVLVKIGSPLCIFLGIVVLVFGGWMALQHRTEADRIKKEAIYEAPTQEKTGLQ